MKKPMATCVAMVGASLMVMPPLYSARAADDYVVNIVLPQTGTAAYVGKVMRSGFEVAIAEVNREGGVDGHPLRAEFYDDGSSPQTAVQITNRILASHPQVIFGSGLTSPCEAMAALMTNGPLMYCVSPGIRPKPGSFVFSTGVGLDDLQLAFVRYFRQRGWTRIAHLATSDATGKNAESGLEKALALPDNASMQVVAHDRFNASDLSVSAQIERIVRAQPQVIFASMTGTPLVNVLKALIQADVKIPIAAPNSAMSYQFVKEYAAVLPKEIYFCVYSFPEDGGFPQQAKAKKKFFASFAAVGTRPDILDANVWDPLMMIVAGLRKLGVAATADQLRNYIDAQVGVPGVNGVFDFKKVPQRGLDVRSALIVSWDATGEKFVVRSEPGGKPLN